jgi:hypothetical protein
MATIRPAVGASFFIRFLSPKLDGVASIRIHVLAIRSAAGLQTADGAGQSQRAFIERKVERVLGEDLGSSARFLHCGVKFHGPHGLTPEPRRRTGDARVGDNLLYYRLVANGGELKKKSSPQDWLAKGDVGDYHHQMAGQTCASPVQAFLPPDAWNATEFASGTHIDEKIQVPFAAFPV